ncbi:hypothetical protein ACCI51_08110 [Microbulbifer echini]|uniref:Stress-induced acidophilic repeat motif-containing protein n=1 Tax=Microbulbifer echini TaxID=1529067 RepID=A0ABV4NML3_9GAMM
MGNYREGKTGRNPQRLKGQLIKFASRSADDDASDRTGNQGSTVSNNLVNKVKEDRHRPKAELQSQ